MFMILIIQYHNQMDKKKFAIVEFNDGLQLIPSQHGIIMLRYPVFGQVILKLNSELIKLS